MTYIDVPHESNLCGAYARTTGKPCRKYAMTNGRCKLHGGKTPIKHGLRTKRAMSEQKQITQLMRESWMVMMNIK